MIRIITFDSFKRTITIRMSHACLKFKCIWLVECLLLPVFSLKFRNTFRYQTLYKGWTHFHEILLAFGFIAFYVPFGALIMKCDGKICNLVFGYIRTSVQGYSQNRMKWDGPTRRDWPFVLIWQMIAPFFIRHVSSSLFLSLCVLLLLLIRCCEVLLVVGLMMT